MSTGLNWRSMKDSKPADQQEILTRMKHGLISGYYNAEDNTVRGYYWRDMEWLAHDWVPIEATYELMEAS